MYVYSDGSVKYAREEGTWAWEAHIAERSNRPNITLAALHLVPSGGGRWKRDKNTGSDGESDKIG
jgi:hypothetical protein